MGATLSELFDVNQFTAGRIAFALLRTRELATGVGDDAIVEACDAGIGAAREAVRVRREYRRKPVPITDGPTPMSVDNQIDRLVGFIHGTCQNIVPTLPETDPLVVAARKVLARAFPSGAAAITSLSFEEELAAVGDLISLFKGPLASEMSVLALTGLVERLEERHDVFAEVLHRALPATVSYGDVKRAEAVAQQRLLEVVARIVGRHPTSLVGDEEGRARLLAPILLQNDRISETYQRRRRLVDVNPDSGEEDDLGSAGGESAATRATPTAGTESVAPTAEAAALASEPDKP